MSALKFLRDVLAQQWEETREDFLIIVTNKQDEAREEAHRHALAQAVQESLELYGHAETDAAIKEIGEEHFVDLPYSDCASREVEWFLRAKCTTCGSTGTSAYLGLYWRNAKPFSCCPECDEEVTERVMNNKKFRRRWRRSFNQLRDTTE
jgi:hypothetical protein